jgi:hypothetical protein
MYSSVGIATGYQLDGWVSIPEKGKTCVFYTGSRPAVGPIQLSI